jgi:TATA-binding protein-associated factor Taf7
MSAKSEVYALFKRKQLLIGAGILSGVLFSLFLATEYVKHQQSVLETQLDMLRTESPIQVEGFSLQALEQGLSQVRSRSSSQTLDILNQLRDALSLDVQISQLIIAHNEIVIDATANNATVLQLALKKLPSFEKVEFIAGVSTDTRSARERFRLKVTLAEPQPIIVEDVK